MNGRNMFRRLLLDAHEAHTRSDGWQAFFVLAVCSSVPIAVTSAFALSVRYVIR